MEFLKSAYPFMEKVQCLDLTLKHKFLFVNILYKACFGGEELERSNQAYAPYSGNARDHGELT